LKLQFLPSKPLTLIILELGTEIKI
jgi:hypothetical protein